MKLIRKILASLFGMLYENSVKNKIIRDLKKNEAAIVIICDLDKNEMRLTAFGMNHEIMAEALKIATSFRGDATQIEEKYL